jgi:hypothetical protein
LTVFRLPKQQADNPKYADGKKGNSRLENKCQSCEKEKEFLYYQGFFLFF